MVSASLYSVETALPTVKSPSGENTEALHEQLSRYGYNTHSFLSLYPGQKAFRLPGVEGYIPYVENHRLALISGDPICPESAFDTLVKAFVAQCRKRRQTVGLIPVTQKTMERLRPLGFDSLYIGKEPIFDLQNLPEPSRSIKQALRRAERKGLRVIPFDESYQAQIETICSQWLNTREMPAMSFLFQLQPLTEKQHKRIFLLADEKGRLLAFLACSPIYARNGWYLEDLIRLEDVPNGGTELLMLTAMKRLAAEGFNMATLALAPLSGLPDRDEEHPLINQLLRLSYEHLSFLYHFQTLEYFKGKFKPNEWEPNYFCFNPPGIRISLINSLVSAFMPTSLPRLVLHKLRQVRQNLKP